MSEPMMRRYTFRQAKDGGGYLVESAQGEWVRFADLEAHDAALRAENERLKAKVIDCSEVDTQRLAMIENGVTTIYDLRAQVTALEQKVIKWQRIRKPTHGNCCTCQRCGLDHDSCRCDLDEVADELEQTKKQLATMTKERDELIEIRRAP